MNISLVSIEKDGIIKLAAEGHLSGDALMQSGQNPMAILIGGQWATNRVLLDMNKSTHIDSSALGWLLTCNKEFSANGGLLVVHTIPPRIQQIFDVLRMGKLLALVKNEQDALKVAQEHEPS